MALPFATSCTSSAKKSDAWWTRLGLVFRHAVLQRHPMCDDIKNGAQCSEVPTNFGSVDCKLCRHLISLDICLGKWIDMLDLLHLGQVELKVPHQSVAAGTRRNIHSAKNRWNLPSVVVSLPFSPLSVWIFLFMFFSFHDFHFSWEINVQNNFLLGFFWFCFVFGGSWGRKHRLNWNQFCFLFF